MRKPKKPDLQWHTTIQSVLHCTCLLSSPRIKTSGQLQHQKSAIHRHVVKSDKYNWLKIQNKYSAYAKYRAGPDILILCADKKDCGLTGDKNGPKCILPQNYQYWHVLATCICVTKITSVKVVVSTGYYVHLLPFHHFTETTYMYNVSKTTYSKLRKCLPHHSVLLVCILFHMESRS